MEKFYAGGFLYNPKTEAVLLHKRDARARINPSSWAFFGGLNEAGETPPETFARELKEELNIDIRLDEIVPLCDYLNEELDTYRHVFFVKSELEKLQMCLGEGEDFEWIGLDRVFGYDLTEKTARDLRLFITKN
jgi:8-oxo-dGTP pyrophosphatase MutT (NUDIX family)